jgi:hypothetical protein
VSSLQKKSGHINTFIVSGNLISFHPIPRVVEGMQCQISEKMSRVVCFQQCRTENVQINKKKLLPHSHRVITVTEFWDCDHETYTLSSVGIYIAHLLKS